MSYSVCILFSYVFLRDSIEGPCLMWCSRSHDHNSILSHWMALNFNLLTSLSGWLSPCYFAGFSLSIKIKFWLICTEVMVLNITLLSFTEGDDFWHFLKVFFLERLRSISFSLYYSSLFVPNKLYKCYQKLRIQFEIACNVSVWCIKICINPFIWVIVL